MTELNLVSALLEYPKWVNRLIMRGGPLRQPSTFFQIRPDEHWTGASLKIDPASSLIFENLREPAVAPMLANERYSIRPGELVQRFLAGAFGKTLVYKPTGRALGSEVFFLSAHPDGHAYQLVTQVQPKEPLYEFLCKRYGARAHGNLAEAYLPSRSASRALEAIFQRPFETPKHNPEFPADLGMAESYLPSWKPDGRMYETRHVVHGDFASGQTTEIVHELARFGKDRWFSNQGLSESAARAQPLRGPGAMFQPLERVTALAQSRLVAHVEEKLTEAFRHYAQALRREGFILDRGTSRSDLQIDLLWNLVPDSLPEPSMTEIEFHYSSDEMWDGRRLQFAER